MLGDVTLTGQDVFNFGVPGLIGFLAWMLRTHMIEGLRRLRFLMGFITLMARVFKELRPILRTIDETKLNETGRKLIEKLRPFVESTAALVDDLLSAPERNNRLSDSTLEMLADALQNHHARKKDESSHET